MKFLILGDIFGPPGMSVIKSKLKNIINEKKIDFTIVNGENAADNGLGITRKNFEELIEVGVNVVTSGNHVWDQKEIIETINNDKRLIRPANFIEGQPGKWLWDIFV